VDAWLGGRFALVTSLYQVEELNRVLSHPRIGSRTSLEESELELILAALLAEPEVVPGFVRLPGVPRDPKDDALAACAVEGCADYLVSGEEELLVLDVYEGIQVVTPRQFLEELEAPADQGQISSN
jgi:putative PIN family toxin of toxin-antitoxin system